MVVVCLAAWTKEMVVTVITLPFILVLIVRHSRLRRRQ